MPFASHQNPNAELFETGSKIAGKPISVGSGFNALSFKHDMYSGAMDPLIMVDHFVMTKPTFGPHAHAGLSAVSILFEDSQGAFHNKDSLGNDVDLMPGDLYWLKAGSGAVHDEKPRPASRTHALQVFVNLPANMKYDAPSSLHVKASDMPTLMGDGYRARLMLGKSGKIQSKQSPTLPMTILDVKLEKRAWFEHIIPAGQAVFLLSTEGSAEVQRGREKGTLSQGSSIAFGEATADEAVVLSATAPAQIVLLQAAPISEPFVQRGPFAMSTQTEVEAMFAAHRAGKLGSIDT